MIRGIQSHVAPEDRRLDVLNDAILVWRVLVNDRFAAPANVFSSYVAASRLPANRHWLSDVVFGSAVGIIAGRTVTATETSKYPVAIAAIPGGVAVASAPLTRSRDPIEIGESCPWPLEQRPLSGQHLRHRFSTMNHA